MGKPKVTTRNRAPDPNKFPPGTKQGDYQKLLAQYMEVIHKMPTMGPTIKDEEYQKLFDKKWANSGFKPETPESAEGSPESTIDKLLKNAKSTKKENSAIIDAWIAKSQPLLDAAGVKADASEAEIMAGLKAAGIQADATTKAAIDEMVASRPAQIKAHKYGGDIGSIAAGADASGESIAYQNQALRELSGLTRPEVTAQERFLEMRARVQEEQSRRAAQDAALQDMQRRGIRSGGAEIGALQGAQQMTSQNRLMQDLGTQAGAVDRAMRATEGLGNLSSQARTQSFDESFKTGSAADDIAMFNSKQKSDYQAWRDKFKSDENEADWKRTTGIADAKRNAGLDTYGHQLTQTDLATGQKKDAYGRTQDQINLGQAGVGMKTGSNLAGSQQVNEGYKTQLALTAEQEAIAALKKKQGGGMFSDIPIIGKFLP